MTLIGLMSGTSLDGVDAVLADFDAAGRPHLRGHCQLPWPESLQQTLREVTGNTPLHRVLALDAALPRYYADAVAQLLHHTGQTAAGVSAIGLHGQTVWHAPHAIPPVTSQIGDPSRLAAASGITVVADFRQRDLAEGGEGAPLAPLFHSALFASAEARGVLNLGGIANLTLLGPGGVVLNGFDCGPANTLLDAWARRHRGMPFDSEGAWAAGGQVDHALLERLLADPFFRRQPPKSTGPEHFSTDWLERHLSGRENPVDVQATLAELTARSTAAAVSGAPQPLQDLVVAGGGAANLDLLARLERAVHPLPVVTSDALGYPAGTVEALGFAWLARAALQGEPLALERVTGARRPARLGGIYPA